jgi:MFS family permease
MQVLAPDLLADVRELSVAVTAAGLVLGLLLWLFGWRGHRFWVVLSATLVGGIAGLTAARAAGGPPLVAGLLAAVAAGILALTLARLLAFVAGAFLVWLLVQTAAPGWDQPLVSMLVGGLLGIALYRLGVMALTSTAGTLLVAYCAVCLLDRIGSLKAIPWAAGHAPLLNWLCGSAAILGVLAQFLLGRRQVRKKREREEAVKKKAAEDEAKKKKAEEDRKRPPKKSWLPWGLGHNRKAG